jgi:hypothetical protein
MRKNLLPEDKLDALRKGDTTYVWKSLDDRRCCIVCDRTFSGRQVDVVVTPSGRVRMHCPSEGCPSSPREWVCPGNPLVSQKAWRDWLRVLDDGKKTARRPGAPARGKRQPSNPQYA